MRTYCDNRGRECMSAKDCASRKVKETEEWEADCERMIMMMRGRKEYFERNSASFNRNTHIRNSRKTTGTLFWEYRRASEYWHLMWTRRLPDSWMKTRRGDDVNAQPSRERLFSRLWAYADSDCGATAVAWLEIVTKKEVKWASFRLEVEAVSSFPWDDHTTRTCLCWHKNRPLLSDLISDGLKQSLIQRRVRGRAAKPQA
jgi:hypothetical protein